MGCQVVAPVMDGEILDSRARSGGRMLVLNWVAAKDLRLSRVRIRFAKAVEEDMVCRLAKRGHKARRSVFRTGRLASAAAHRA